MSIPRLVQMGLLAGIVLMFSCAMDQEDMIRLGEVSVIDRSSDEGRLLKARVTRSDGRVHISGSVRRAKSTRPLGGEHVDIAVTGPNGRLVLTASSRVYFHRYGGRAGGMTALRRSGAFSEDLPALPHGAVIYAAYHAAGGDEGKDCLRNVLPPEGRGIEVRQRHEL